VILTRVDRTAALEEEAELSGDGSELIAGRDHTPLPFDGDDDETAAAFDDLPVWAAPFGAELLRLVELGRGTAALDVGFGCGFPLLELAGMLGETGRVYGVDLWRAGMRRALRTAEQRRLRGVQVLQAAAEHLPFPAGCFDRIVSNNGFNNVQDMGAAFADAHRVARAGAQLVFTMNTEETMAELYSEYRQVLEERGLPASVAALREHIRAPESCG
jgi:ubiquinone/menaquinone biosynthesis C-methylase UbiE